MKKAILKYFLLIVVIPGGQAYIISEIVYKGTKKLVEFLRERKTKEGAT